VDELVFRIGRPYPPKRTKDELSIGCSEPDALARFAVDRVTTALKDGHRIPGFRAFPHIRRTIESRYFALRSLKLVNAGVNAQETG
jgi:hypothetical protein